MKPTLQILDAGDTFFRPLEDRPLRIGSGEGVDVRLRAAGVEPEHARIEPDGGDRFRIVDLSTDAGTRVNGEDVAQWRLSIGDRIEVGAAVLVVGQQIARPATPTDVLDEGAALARAGAELRRRRLSREAAPARRGRVVAIAVGGLALLALLFALTRGGDGVPVRWGDLVAMRRQGQVADGLALAEQLRATWAGDDADRNARIDTVVADLEEIARRVEQGRERIRAEAPSTARNEQVDALKQLRAAGDDTVSGIVGRLLLSELDELRLGRGRTFDDPTYAAGGAPPAQPARAADPARVEPGSEPAAPTSEGERFVADQLAAIDALRAEGRYAEALETMGFALSATDARFAEPLREARIRLRAEVDREMRAVIDRAHEMVRGGDPAQVERAVAMLRAEGLRFPADGEFGRIVAEQRELEEYGAELARRAELATTGAAPSAPTLAELRDLLAEASRAERDGDFAGAGRALQRAADAVRHSDPLYAQSLDGRRQDLELLGWLAAFVRAELEAGRPVEVELADRGRVAVALDQGVLRVDGEPLQWSAVQPQSVADLLERGTVGGDVLLGGAVHAYRAGDREIAESLLVRAVRRDPALQPQVDGVIGRGRGETVGDAGYQLVGGAFVAVRELETRKRAKELEKTVGRIARLADDRRDAELEKILAGGPQELDALLIALRAAAAQSAARIERDGFRRHWDKVAQAREALDAARRHAVELIFDEARYFYPFKPPAVSAEKATEYWKVQGEVDERVAAVRALWDDDGAKKRVPARLLQELGELDWYVAVLQGFGERVPGLADQVAWVRALPTDEPLELRNFAWDAREAAERAHNRRVLAFNQKKYEALNAAEVAQVEITNAYRMLFGHRPLAVNTALVEAARGHADEMARLGFFSHFSPTPGRKTPFERMKLAGYAFGVSENIANHPSAESAHHGWTHSSGHHRNLLGPSHHEFAVGNSGRQWVQNFGRGQEFTKDPDWAKLD